MFDSFFRVTAKVGADTSDFDAAMKKMEKHVSSSMAEVGKRIAQAFTVGAAIEFARKVAQMTGEIADLADQLSITTDEVQALQKAADRSGLSFDKYAATLSKIRKLRAEALSGDASAMAKFGRAGLDPNSDALTLMRQIGGLPDERAFEILDSKSARLKNSLSDIKALGPLELISEKTIRDIDTIQDFLGDIGRIGKALIIGGMGKDIGMAAFAISVAKAFAEADQATADGRALPIPTNRIEGRETTIESTVDVKRTRLPVGYNADENPALPEIRPFKFSRVDLGDRANIGGFFGPNADLNQKLVRLTSDVTKIANATTRMAEALEPK